MIDEQLYFNANRGLEKKSENYGGCIDEATYDFL